MKVGIYLKDQPQKVGGGYTFANELVNALIKFGSQSHHSFVLLSSMQELDQSIQLPQHIEFKSFYFNSNKRLISKYSYEIYKLFHKLRHPNTKTNIKSEYEKHILKIIRDSEIDIIWSLTPYYLTLEIPSIVTVWDLEHRLQPYFPELSSEGQWDQRENIYGKMLKAASIIITGTEIGKEQIERFYQVPEERVKVLPFPTPDFALCTPSFEDKVILAKYKIPDNYLFYPAQFWPHKNHAALLLAVRHLRDKHNLDFPVVFVGSDKGNESYIRKIVADLNLSQQVHFLGFVPQEDLISLYRNAFALTFMSLCGPDNLPPLESFALGCPVIASEISGAREQLGDSALLVNARDPEQIALAIKLLWDDKALSQTLVQRGLTLASRWTGKDYINGILSILDEFEPIRRCWSNKEVYHQI